MRERLLAARAKRVRPGLDDKVLADWNGLMIAALVTASLAFDEPAWLAMAARAFLFIDADGARRPPRPFLARGQLVVPGLASDHAAMIRAAPSRSRGHRRARLSRAGAGLAGHARPPLRQSRQWRLLPHRRRRPRPGGAAQRHHRRRDPESKRAWRRNPIRLAVFTGQHAWRDKADRLFDGILASAGDNPFGHLALLNALDLRLRAAEIVVTGDDARAADLSPPPASFPSSIASCCAHRTGCRRRIPRRTRSRRPQRARRSSASARPARCR